MIPQWLSVGVMVAGWGIGFRIGWHIVDKWLERRREQRERHALQMRDVTPT